MKTKRTFLELVADAKANFEGSFVNVFRAEYLVIIIALLLSWSFKNGYISKEIFLNIPENIIITIAIIISIIFSYIGILNYIWHILIIKNSMIYGKVDSWKTFKQALSKSPKIYAISIIKAIPYLVLFILIFLFWRNSLFLIILISLILLWALLAVPGKIIIIGLILEDGNFKDVLKLSVRICFDNYFKILWFLTFKRCFVIYFPLDCFMIELYLDLLPEEDKYEGSNKGEDLNELLKSYPDVIDVNQPQESIYQEGTLEHRAQSPHKDEIPDGLHRLGSNYEDKK